MQSLYVESAPFTSIPPLCFTSPLLFHRGDALDREFTIAEWPAKHKTAQEALFEMWDDGTHRVNYLPVGNHHNQLMHPVHYGSRLRNALVEIHFTMKHRVIPEGPDGR